MKPQNYRIIKQKVHRFYQEIGKVNCPYLKTEVNFNSNGFWHIVYRSRGKNRDLNSQVLRFRLLPKAIDIIKITHTLQEYEARTREFLVIDHGKKVPKIVTINYYGFIAILEGWKIKVVVKKRGNGRPFFWSVIPNWQTRTKENLKVLKLAKGDLEED